MTSSIKHIRIGASPKGVSKDLDKAVPPAETVARVLGLLEGKAILQELKRIDVGRLGIPVYLSVCGAAAKDVMPTRKQMGKGSSPEQAQASALMELVERYSFFSYWDDPANLLVGRYSQALAGTLPGQTPAHGKALPIAQVLASVGEPLERFGDEAAVLALLDLVDMQFGTATDLVTGEDVLVPLSWFRRLGEFNGTSAGNTPEESILQGLCELVERHVCCLVDRERPTTLPTIDMSDPASGEDPVLAELLRKFADNGIEILLKDFSMGLPVPTVGAAAWDPETFPQLSEVVFTAGTATSPAKAAVRALTEVAQLAGDFITGACYEASGLHKPASWDELAWLRQGPVAPLKSLPDIRSNDMGEELRTLVQGLNAQGWQCLSVDLTLPGLGLPAHYNIVPGMAFRERDRHASVGMFIGRQLAEEAPADEAREGLALLEQAYPDAHFVPFFQGLFHLREGEFLAAAGCFEEAEPLQPDEEAQALAAFYQGYVWTLLEDWSGAVPCLDRALGLTDEVKEYFNLRGVCHFKQGRYESAATDFEAALRLDKGSAIDLANLGLCKKHLGLQEEACELLRAAVALDAGLDFAARALQELESASR
ncbi:YcaO-like family protein [Megalodesulfovibrio paquesii]